MPLPKTIAAASGSCQMLNSAAAVVFPSPSEPPMRQIRSIPSRMRGRARRRSATFVSGPVATSVTGRPAPATSASVSASAPSGRGAAAGSGRSAPSRPLSPWNSTGVQVSRRSARSAPARHRDVVPAEQGQDAQRVARRVGQRRVAADGRDPQQLQLRAREGERDRQGVVVARVAVQDDRGADSCAGVCVTASCVGVACWQCRRASGGEPTGVRNT